MSSQIKHWFFLYFVNGDPHIFPQKHTHTWSGRLRFIPRSFLKLESFRYNKNNGNFVIHCLSKPFGTWFYFWIRVHLEVSSCRLWKLPRQEIAKVKAKGAYSQSVKNVCKQHDGHYFCILRSIVLKQFRKYVGMCQTFYK